MPLISSTLTELHEADTVFGRLWFLNRYQVSDKWTPIKDVTVLSTPPLPCDFTVLALPWGILQCLAQEGTPVKDSNHGCHLSLVGFIVHNKNALHSDSQSKGHWPEWYILSNQKRRLTFPEFSPPSKKRDLIQEPSQSKPGIYRKLLYYNLGKKKT